MRPEKRELPFHDGDDSIHGPDYTTTTFQHGGHVTERGTINPSYDNGADICENHNNIVNQKDIDTRLGDESGEDNETKNSNIEYKSLVPFCLVIGVGTLFSQSATVYLSSQITVLEKVFGLSSAKSGILLSANDIGFVLTVLMASHFLKNQHIPRVLALCIFVFGVSSVLTSLPHFIGDESNQWNQANSSSADEYLCVSGRHVNISGNLQTCIDDTPFEETSAQRGNQWMVILIGAMMVIQGVAKSPRIPLSSLYVDSNADKNKTGFYMGILLSFSIFGPLIAMTAGGFVNKIPVDLKETSLTPDDPRWIGAWWLGFIIFGACAILISFPIFFFPASLKKDDDKSTQPAEYANSSAIDSQQGQTLSNTVKDMPKSVIRVLRNPVYACNMLSAILMMFAFVALVAFGPKYIENQFRIPTWKANVLLGLQMLVSTVTGTFAGGVITRRFRLGLFGCVKMIFICRLLSFTCQTLNFLWGCDTPPIIGLDANDSSSQNSSCECSMTQFLPVCADGQTYFSPCHAGCTAEIQGVYSNCTSTTSDGSLGGQVTTGICDTGCTYLIPFVVLNSLSSLIGTLCVSPTYVTNLRSVDGNDRAMAVGMQTFLMALLVFLPAPILIGNVFDSVCRVWSSACSSEGSCSLYDVKDMRLRLIAISLGLYTASVLVTCLTYLFAKKKETDDNRRSEKSMEIKLPVPQPRPSLIKITNNNGRSQ